MSTLLHPSALGYLAIFPLGLGFGLGLGWTTDTKDTKWVLKRVLVRIAAFYCARRAQIWIPEIEYYQKVSSHAQIGPQGAEKLLRKVNVV